MARQKRRGGRSRGGMAALAGVCVLALAAGFLLEEFLPRQSAADAAVSTSGVRLSEVMADNASAHRDESGRLSDWVELVNTGATEVSLEGYRLVDGDAPLSPLTLPAVALAPGGRLLVYCDGGGRGAVGEIRAPFRIDADGAQLMLYDADGARCDVAEVPALSGNEVYRRNAGTGAWEASGEYTPGLANTRENHLALEAERGDSPIIISEASSANRTYAPDAGGRCHDYIELFNPSAADVELYGYALTDDAADPGKWVFPEGARVPAGGYLLIYASDGAAGAVGEWHAPFKLDSAGETLLLFDPEGYAVCSLPLPALGNDQAYSLGEGRRIHGRARAHARPGQRFRRAARASGAGERRRRPHQRGHGLGR